MPLPTSFTTFTDGDTITANDFNRRVVDVETFINGDIEISDLPTTPWVESHIIQAPLFFGSPAPRVQLVSADVHFRRETGGEHTQIFHANMSQDFIPIMGLNATIHVAIPDGFPADTVQATIRASLFAENENSAVAVRTAFSDNTNRFVTKVGDCAIFVNDTQITGTRRKVYSKTAAEHPITGGNLNMVARIDLKRGTHNLGVRFKPVRPSNAGDFQHTFIRHRTLNIEVNYL